MQAGSKHIPPAVHLSLGSVLWVSHVDILPYMTVADLLVMVYTLATSCEGCRSGFASARPLPSSLRLCPLPLPPSTELGT